MEDSQESDVSTDDYWWFPELPHLLRAYNAVPESERFTDAEGAPSKAMRTYLRIARYHPGRATRAVQEIQAVLDRGLDDPEVLYELPHFSRLGNPPSRSREECLVAMVPHLRAFADSGEQVEPALPETSWEWRERLPNLSQLLGAYFHQDIDAVYPGAESLHEAAIDDYLATSAESTIAAAAQEIAELFEIGRSEEIVGDAVEAFGLAWLPPEGQTYGQWLDGVAARLTAHLDSVGYRPPDGLDPAYLPTDIRARGQREP